MPCSNKKIENLVGCIEFWIESFDFLYLICVLLGNYDCGDAYFVVSTDCFFSSEDSHLLRVLDRCST